MTRSSRRLVLAVAGLVLLVGTAPAQIGGVVRRAASNTVVSQGKNAAITVPPDQRITSGTLDQLERGLATQLAALSAAKQAQGNAKTPQAYGQCAGPVMASPEMQKVTKDYTDALAAANGNNDRIIAAAQRYGDNMKAALAAKCGPDPDKTMDASRNAARDAETKGQQASGMTGEHWSIIKERIAPFCNLPSAKRGGGDVRAEGQYVYLKSEADVLAPRCETIMAKMKSAT